MRIAPANQRPTKTLDRACQKIIRAWQVNYKLRHARDLDADKDTKLEERRK